MLPKDAEMRRKDAHAKNQPRLDPHLREKPQKEMVIPYTDERFREAAIDWLASTDQVCEICSSCSVSSPHVHYSLFKHSNTHLFKT
jgi:hypothetical protein